MRQLVPTPRSRPFARSIIGAAFVVGALVALVLHGPGGRAPRASPPTESVSVPPQPSVRGVASAVAVGVQPAPPSQPIAASTPSPSEAAPSAERTPLGEDEAAVHLARAWRSVAGGDPKPETLALLWAQWAHETGRGRRMRGFNFAGIKGSGPEGDSFMAWTREDHPERLTRDAFRAYSTPEGGAQDYVRLLSSRYPAAWRAALRGDVVRFVRALDLGGYFTDSDRAYSRALSSLARECLERSVPRRALEVVARGALMPAAEPKEI